MRPNEDTYTYPGGYGRGHPYGARWQINRGCGLCAGKLVATKPKNLNNQPRAHQQWHTPLPTPYQMPVDVA